MIFAGGLLWISGFFILLFVVAQYGGVWVVIPPTCFIAGTACLTIGALILVYRVVKFLMTRDSQYLK
jgi:hypothetical protein